MRRVSVGTAGGSGASAPAASEGCREVQTVSGEGMAVAACAAGELVLGGGGSCNDRLTPGNESWAAGQLQASYPDTGRPGR